MIQEIEQEELKSRQRKNGLKIKTELVKAKNTCTTRSRKGRNRREFTGRKKLK